jgi:hypothetical protein
MGALGGGLRVINPVIGSVECRIRSHYPVIEGPFFSCYDLDCFVALSGDQNTVLVAGHPCRQ